MKYKLILICGMLLVLGGGCCVWHRRAYDRNLWNPDERTPADREEYDDDLKPLESTER